MRGPAKRGNRMFGAREPFQQTECDYTKVKGVWFPSWEPPEYVICEIYVSTDGQCLLHHARDDG